MGRMEVMGKKKKVRNERGAIKCLRSLRRLNENQ